MKRMAGIVTTAILSLGFCFAWGGDEKSGIYTEVRLEADLAGLDAETGVVMLLYLDLAYERFKGRGLMANLAHLTAAVNHGAVQRIRPKMMTVATILFSLVPILWATGTGADVMRRIAAPMLGGVITSFIAELIVFPAIYFIWRSIKLSRSLLFPPTSGEEESAVG
mgnify:CR=1 FL=1